MIEKSADFRFVGFGDGVCKITDNARDFFALVSYDFTDKDFRVFCPQKIFARDFQFFKKFFAFADARKFDVNILIRFETGKPDHIFRQI